MPFSVLVVDSQASVREALTRLLENRAYQVTAVDSRAEAFDRLDAERFDLLILDDPARERCYRLVWLAEDVPDARVELIDLDPSKLSEQFASLVPDGAPSLVDSSLVDSGVVALDPGSSFDAA